MEPVQARQGMVASAEGQASAVGVEILKQGGNAVDAAVAVAFALAVTYPVAGNLGGGGFLLLRRPDGKTGAIDYREMAPARANRTVFLDPKGSLISGEGGSLIGYRAAGVPGTVAGMALAHQKYGSRRLSWRNLLEPARRLASDGFTVSGSLARSLQGHKSLLNRYAESRRIFLASGKGWRTGERFRQPELAETLARLQKNGSREFYEGETARHIAADMAAHNGLINADDLRRYVAKERAPLIGQYRGYGIVSMPPPSSGGIALLQMLALLEGFGIHQMPLTDPRRYHLLIEAMRRAFADRAVFPADPDFVKVPVTRLLDAAYLDERRSNINPAKASDSRSIRAGEPGPPEPTETTHFSIVDKDGMAVSNTYTLNGGYGSGATVKGTGILLNNEMDDFAARPGTPNLFGLIQGEKNAVGPRKRPLSSMTPTFVLHPDGKLYFAIGSPGGPTIINTVLQVILNVVDGKQNIAEAIAAPRIHHQWVPDEVAYEPDSIPAITRLTLQQYGHRLSARPRFMGDAQGILLDPRTGARHGASDKRGSGATVGY